MEHAHFDFTKKEYIKKNRCQPKRLYQCTNTSQRQDILFKEQTVFKIMHFVKQFLFDHEN